MGERKSKDTELDNPIAEERRRDLGSKFQARSKHSGNCSFLPRFKGAQEN